MSTWFITGCSTGLGRALAEATLAAGHRVVITARDPETIIGFERSHPETALVLPLDVTRADQLDEAVRRAEERFGGVDVLINNAGYGLRAAVEEAEPGDVQRLFDTHVFGPVALIKRVLPGMRERRSGTIVNISSIGARVSPAGSGYYSGAKSALEGITRSLRAEVAPLGITAMVIEPGGFRTDFAGRSLTQSDEAIADYADTAGKRRKEHDRVHGTQPGDPAKAARAVITAVESPEPPALLLLGSDALAAVGAVLTAEQAEIERWRDLSAGTDFEAPAN